MHRAFSLKSQIAAVVLVQAALLFFAHASASAQRADDKRGVVLKKTEEVKAWPGASKRWALVIGIDDYTDGQISSLRGAANDARSLADALVEHAGFPRDQVTLLSTAQPATLQPKRNTILRHLVNLRGNVPKDGLLLVAFAGHGIERGGKAYLLPSDAESSKDVTLLEETAIEVGRVREMIRATGVEQVLLVLDACRNDPAPGRAGGDNLMTKRFADGFNFDLRNRDIKAFATLYATNVGERAYEYPLKRQGYFTWALVEALKGAAANDKGEVTLARLVKYVQEIVPKYVHRDIGADSQQQPFSIIEGYRAEELIVAVAPRTTLAPETAKENVATLTIPASASPVPLGPALSKNEIITMLNGGISPERIAQFVESRGVTFALTQEIVREITAAGATRQLIAAIFVKAPGDLAELFASIQAPAPTGKRDYDEYIDKIQSSVSTSDWSSAISYAQQAIRLDPSQPAAYSYLGQAMIYGRNDFAGAEQAMRAAIERGGSAAFRIYHDHDGSFGQYCVGSFFVTKTGVSFRADNGVDTFETPDTNIKEAKTNGWVGAQLGAFHIKPIQKVIGRDNFSFAPGSKNKAESQLIINLIQGY